MNALNKTKTIRVVRKSTSKSVMRCGSIISTIHNGSITRETDHKTWSMEPVQKTLNEDPE